MEHDKLVPDVKEKLASAVARYGAPVIARRLGITPANITTALGSGSVPVIVVQKIQGNLRQLL